MACIFTVGEKFDCFASLSEKIKQFELENCVQLCKRDARKIAAAKTITKSINEDLVGYFQVVVEVKKLSDQHNHIVEKKLFQHLARQRKLSDVERTEVEKLLQLDCNKKVLQQKVMSETNKIVTLKDIHNILKLLKQKKEKLAMTWTIS